MAAVDVEVNYNVAARVHKKVYGKEISPEEIKNQVAEIRSKSHGILTVQGAFRMWLKELKLDKEYDKAIKQVRTMEKKEKAEVKTVSKRKLEKKVIINVDEELMFIENLVDDGDLAEIFGHTGSGKTLITTALAVNKAQHGHNVGFLDIEGNITSAMKNVLVENKVKVERIRTFNEFYEYCKNIERNAKDLDFVFIDSLGLRALGAFAGSNMKQKGDILLKIQEISGYLKDFAEVNESYVVMTNQPISEMGTSSKIKYYPPNFKEVELPDWSPWGDKHSFFVKEILQSVLVSRNGRTSICDLFAYRSRFLPFGHPVARLKVSMKKNNGTLEQVIEVEELI